MVAQPTAAHSAPLNMAVRRMASPSFAVCDFGHAHSRFGIPDSANAVFVQARTAQANGHGWSRTENGVIQRKESQEQVENAEGRFAVRGRQRHASGYHSFGIMQVMNESGFKALSAADPLAPSFRCLRVRLTKRSNGHRTLRGLLRMPSAFFRSNPLRVRRRLTGR